MRHCLVSASWLLLALPLAFGQSDDAIQVAAEQTKIESAAIEFVAAYNKHDAKGLAAKFTDDAELAERDGGRFIGREEIEAAFNEVFQQNPEAKISLDVDSIRFVTPNVAIEEGVTIWFPDGEIATTESTYRVAHVKRNGQWLIAGARTIDDDILTNYEYLRDLEWMVGDWFDEGRDSLVETSVRWAPNRAYLLRDFAVKTAGQTMLTGTQRIGWDSRKKQYRSWTFDSEGGYSEGLWTRVGDGYVIRSNGYLRDGLTVSGTTRIDLQDQDRFTWSMFNRLRGDEILPDVDVTIVRKPPQPADAAK